jgi:ABC-2 type transport system permease protein
MTTAMRLARVYVLESRLEFTKLLRMPGYLLPTISFPVLFYLFFGVLMAQGRPGGRMMATYLIASYGAFGVIGIALFGFGVQVAVERGQGWLQVKRASPMPPAAYLVAKVVMAILFGTIVVTMLGLVGTFAAGVHFRAASWFTLVGVLALGAIPFCLLGLVIGLTVTPATASPFVNVVHLPMAVLSGLWIPVEMLPPGVRGVSPWLPAYHLGQLALQAIGVTARAPWWHHAAFLAGFSLLAAIAAGVAYRRGRDQYGA